MKSFSFFNRLFLVSAFSLALATPALAAEAAKPAPADKPAAAAPAKADKTSAPASKKAATPAKKSSAAAPKAAKGKHSAPAGHTHSPEVLQRGLDEFAHKTIATLNRCVVPSLGKKEITKNADGTFTARYIEIDPKSIRTSYKTPNKPGPVAYIGYMSYNEIEYHCTAPSKTAAEKGPFAPKNSKMLTELIKHLNGKWTY